MANIILARLKVLHFFIKNFQHYFYQTFVIGTSIKIYSFFCLDSRFAWEVYASRMEYPLPPLKDPPPELVESCNEKKIASHFYFGDTCYEMRKPRETFSNKYYYKLSAVVVCR